VRLESEDPALAGCLKFKSEIACVTRMEAGLLVAEKRLSNELADTIGCEPATASAFATETGASGVPESDGFSIGRWRPAWYPISGPLPFSMAAHSAWPRLSVLRRRRRARAARSRWHRLLRR